MTERELLDRLRERLELFGATISLPVYHDSAVPAEPPATGYVGWKLQAGQLRQSSRGGERFRTAGIAVLAVEIYVPRASYGEGVRYCDELQGLLMGWTRAEISSLAYEATDVPMPAGSRFWQRNVLWRFERLEDQVIPAA